MSLVRHGARQTMAWLHGWSGLLLGWVLFVMCLGGTFSVFKPEIGRWMRPETIAPADPVRAIAAATDWLGRHDAGAAAWYLTAPDGRANTVEAVYTAGSGFVFRALDPVTGAPVARETLGGEFFYRLHFELQLPYPWGRLLACVAAMAMLLALITGIIAHRRIFRDFFTFRPGKGQRSWLDGHNALGVLALPFHLMITFTGLVTLASLFMPWGIAANYGKDLPALYRDMTPGVVARAASGRKAPLAPIVPMLREAERRFGGGTPGRVTITNPGDAAAIVTVYRSDVGQIGYTPAEMSFDGATGRVLAAWTEGRPAVETYNIVYGMHMARFAPALMRWLYALGGAMLTLAIATGMVLWVAKRRERAPLSIGHRLVERLNVGVIGGVPIGFAAFFWANRLLPLGIVGRADAEVSLALETAGVALIVGLAVRPALGWPAMFAVLTVAWSGAPLLDGGPSRFVAALARGDGAVAGGDLLMIGAALVFAALAGRAIRSRRAPEQPGKARPARGIVAA